MHPSRVLLRIGLVGGGVSGSLARVETVVDSATPATTMFGHPRAPMPPLETGLLMRFR